MLPGDVPKLQRALERAGVMDEIEQMINGHVEAVTTHLSCDSLHPVGAEGLREAARILAESKRVVVVDTSNEIGGDGDVPHPAVGRARRMQVAQPSLQHEVMIEAVENHNPQVIVIDEIGRQLEAEAARTMVNAIANPQMPEIGERYVGTVVKTTSFGAFISLTPGRDGLLHISQIRKMVGGKRIDAVEDVLGVGQKVQVQIGEIDQRGKLSLVPVLDEEAAAADVASAESADANA